MIPLPDFPNFVSLNLSHRALVQSITNQHHPYSDFNFTSMFAWNVKEEIVISSLYDNLVVRFTDYINDEVFFSLIGKNKLESTIDTLLAYCRSIGVEPRLRLVPKSVVGALTPEAHAHYTIEEDRNNHDYILSVQELCDFTTSRFRRKKELHNQFVRSHGENVVFRPLDLHSEEVLFEMQNVATAWQQSRGKSINEARNELDAIKRSLKHHQDLSIKAVGVYIKGKLVAFNIFELLPGKVAMGHFIKADVDFKGIFEYLVHNSARYLKSLGIEYINIEQDLGINGLRKYKESYKPIGFLRKYTISQKQQSFRRVRQEYTPVGNRSFGRAKNWSRSTRKGRSGPNPYLSRSGPSTSAPDQA